MTEFVSFVGLGLALIALYLSNLKRPNIRVAVQEPGFSPLGVLQTSDGDFTEARVVAQVFITNSGAKAGVLFDMEPYPEHTIGGRRPVKYSCAVMDDEDREYALPFVVPAAGTVLRRLNFHAYLSAGDPGQAPPLDEDQLRTELRIWYFSTGGFSFKPRRRGRPIIKRRHIDITTDLLIFEEPDDGTRPNVDGEAHQ